MSRFSEFLKGEWAFALSLILFLSIWGVVAVGDYTYFVQGSEESFGGEEAYRDRTVPFRDTDSIMWITMAAEGQVRPGPSQVDADGRMSYWSSPFLWLIYFLSVFPYLFGESWDKAVQIGAHLTGPFLGLVGGLGFLFWGRKWIKMPLYLLFVPALFLYPVSLKIQSGVVGDHHSLILVVVLAMFASLFTLEKKFWSVFWASFWTAFLLWLSTLTAIPLIGFVGVAVLACSVMGRPPVDPVLWRYWGRFILVFGMLFWLIDFVPNRVGMRLEVIHPLWLLSVWGGAELLCMLSAWLSGKKIPELYPGGTPGPAFVLFGFLAMLAPASAWLSEGSWFIPLYPILQVLMAGISELQPAKVESLTLQFLFLFVGLALLGGMVIGALADGKKGKMTSGNALFVSICGVFFWVFTLVQVRWMPVVFPVVILALFYGASIVGSRLVFRGIFGLVLIQSVFLLFVGVRSGKAMIESPFKQLNSTASFSKYSELGKALREDSGGEPVNFFTVPSPGAGVAYFSGAKAIGSIYWESWEGLSTSGKFFGKASDGDGLAYAREHDARYAVLARDAGPQVYFDLYVPFKVLRENPDVLIGNRLREEGDKLPIWAERVAESSDKKGGYILVRILSDEEISQKKQELETSKSGNEKVGGAAVGVVSGLPRA